MLAVGSLLLSRNAAVADPVAMNLVLDFIKYDYALSVFGTPEFRTPRLPEGVTHVARLCDGPAGMRRLCPVGGPTQCTLPNRRCLIAASPSVGHELVNG
jgi:hypothetical protein